MTRSPARTCRRALALAGCAALLGASVAPQAVASPPTGGPTTTTTTTVPASTTTTTTVPPSTTTTTTVPPSTTTTTVPRSTTTTTTTTTTTVPPSTTTTTTVPRSTTTTTVPARHAAPTTTTTTIVAPPSATTTVPARPGAPATTTTTVAARQHAASAATRAQPKHVPHVATSGGRRRHKGKQAPVPKVTAAEKQAAVESVTAAIDRLDDISAYVQLEHQVATDKGSVAAAVRHRQAADSQVGVDVAASQRDTAHAEVTDHTLVELAIAAYTGAAYGNPEDGPDAVEASGSQARAATHDEEAEEADVLLDIVTAHVERLLHQADHRLAAARATDAAARAQAIEAARLISTDRRALAGAETHLAAARVAATAPADATTEAAITSGGASTTGRRHHPDPASVGGGPSILGPPRLSAAELAGWYASTGEHDATTVPMSELAADYIAAAKKTGVRADLAFAQSIVETAYFSFPSGGQLDGHDNNFAGIGACDSCAHGWRFQSALDGVTAQMELLEAYATPHRVPTPLIGPVGVGGCCTTWMALAGTWATSPTYGIEILAIYTDMLDWAIPGRLVAAGLAPAPAKGRSGRAGAGSTSRPASGVGVGPVLRRAQP